MSGRTALFVAPEAPYPLAGGGALRSASLLEYLARRYAVDVLLFREPGAADPRRAMPAGLARRVDVIALPYHRNGLPARSWRNAGRLLRGVPPLVDRFAGFEREVEAFIAGRYYDLAVVEHFWCARYHGEVAARAGRTVLDLHNVESVLHARCAGAERAGKALAHRIFARAALALEREWLRRYGCVLAPSAEDAARVRAIAPQSRVAVYPNALPGAPPPAREEEHAIAFSGNLGYHPNISAVRFFAREIWPHLRARHAGLRWRLIGRNEHAVARHLAGDPRIEASGPVEDAVAELARVKVAVVPLLAGSGTRLKILEAWAAGTAVVSTSIGAEGLPAEHNGNMLMADTAADFCAAVDALLGDACLRARLGAAGRALFERRFTWEAAWAGLEL